MKFIFFLASMLIIGVSTIRAQASGNVYMDEIKKWQQDREASLRSEYGWLNLAGLYWLQPGENSFGSGTQNNIVFPAGKIAERAGVFENTGNTVRLHVLDTAIKIDGKPVTDALVFSSDSIRQPLMTAGSLRWTIIKRQDMLGIRLRDLKSARIQEFKGIDRYATDTNWIVKAVLHKPALSAQIMITNVVGQTGPEPSPGKLFFTINGNNYTLDALEEDGKLFIIFADETSGVETYGAGRFLKATMPGADGITTLDFNKAYNPPCAFTPFATCPLPPSQNVLPIAITAGEKDWPTH